MGYYLLSSIEVVLFSFTQSFKTRTGPAGRPGTWPTGPGGVKTRLEVGPVKPSRPRGSTRDPVHPSETRSIFF
jgi:hypothetical protein